MFQVNNLFDVGVTTRGPDDFMYSLYHKDDDSPLIEMELGSDFTSSGESMMQVGLTLARKWAKEKGEVLMHAVGTRYKGWFEVKWWSERMARDTTAEFNKQLNRPELVDVDVFDYLIPSGSYNDNTIQLLHALMAYLDTNGVTLLNQSNTVQVPTNLLKTCLHVMNMLPRTRTPYLDDIPDTYKLASKLEDYLGKHRAKP